MAQPPDDRRPMPWEPPGDEPGSDEPTVPWTPPETPPPDIPEADAAPPDAAASPDATPLDAEPPATDLTAGTEPASSTLDAPPPSVGEAPTTPPPDSPLISWTPSGDAAVGAAAAGAGVGAGAAGAAGAGGGAPGAPMTVPGSPFVGWESPDAGVPAAPVGGYVIAGVGSRLVAWFLDIVMLGFFLGFLFIVLAALTPSVTQDPDTFSLVSSILIVGLTFLYFVGLWTSGSGATIGMRLLSLRVVAQAGGTLDIGPAVIRWLALAYWVSLLTIVPVLAAIGNWVYTIWLIVLLLTTAMSPVNQGLHDRWARSAVIRKADARSNPILIGCLILALLGVLLVVILPALAFMSITPEMWEEILSQVGEPT